MTKPRLLLLSITIMCPIHRALAMSGSTAQSPQNSPSLTTRLQQALTRESNGHSPTSEDIANFSDLEPAPDAATATLSLPFLLKALSNSDPALRALALTAINGLQTAPVQTPAATTPNDATKSPTAPPTEQPPSSLPVAKTTPIQPTAYKSDVAHAITPAIPQIASHLTDESEPNRLLAATALGGFTPNPPPTLYPPLLAYLKRDDAISPIGLAVVADLLQLGPVSGDTAAAITRYLRRSDQTPDSRTNLVEAIAAAPYQSQTLNKSLLTYLNSDDPSLRARIILSLPQLDLTPETFADTKARIAQLAENPTENLQVVTAAKAVAACWTAPKMTAGCPVYQ